MKKVDTRAVVGALHDRFVQDDNGEWIPETFLLPKLEDRLDAADELVHAVAEKHGVRDVFSAIRNVRKCSKEDRQKAVKAGIDALVERFGQGRVPVEVREAWIFYTVGMFDVDYFDEFAPDCDRETLRYVAAEAIWFGCRMTSLALHLRDGNLIDARRAQLGALKRREYSDRERSQIRNAYAACRQNFSSDAAAFRHVAAALAELDLTEHSVRHVIKPRRGKTK